MHIILVRENFVKSCYLYVTRSVLLPSVFLSLLLLGSVPYAAYHYKGGHHTGSTHGKKWSSSNQRGLSTVPAEATKQAPVDHPNSLASRLERLQTEVTRLDNLGKKLVTRSEKDSDASLSWSEVIATEMSGNDQKQRQAVSRRLATSSPLKAPLKETYLANKIPVNNNLKAATNEVDDLGDEPVLNCHSGTAPRDFPAGYPVKVGYLSSCYGWRGRRMHKGVDIATKRRSDVLAVADGVVTYSGYMRGYGYMVEIKHGDMYSTRYGHNTENTISVGDFVKKGQTIALAGATGHATGVHVHFEVRQEGIAINPANYLTSLSDIKLSDNVKLSRR